MMKMTIDQMLQKVRIGISPLTGALVIFYPYADGSARAKKVITDNFGQTKNVLKHLLEETNSMEKEIHEYEKRIAKGGNEK